MIVLTPSDSIRARLLAVPSGGLLSVAIGAGGTGYTNGTQALTLVQAGAADGVISVTVTLGVITAILSITTPGTGYSVATGLAFTGGGAGANGAIDVTVIYQPSFVCSYIDSDDTPGVSTGKLSGTTSVTIVPPPTSGFRMVKRAIVFNSDLAAVTPIIEYYAGAAAYEIVTRESLPVNEALEF